MREINATWNEGEQAYVSERMELTGDCVLRLQMERDGWLVIKQEKDGRKPMVYKEKGGEFTIRIFGETAGSVLYAYVSEAPVKMEIIEN